MSFRRLGLLRSLVLRVLNANNFNVISAVPLVPDGELIAGFCCFAPLFALYPEPESTSGYTLLLNAQQASPERII